MSSASSTSGPEAQPGSFRAKHFYLIGSMVAATVAVVVSPHTHPAALVLLSAGLIGAGLVGSALHQAILGFLNASPVETDVLPASSLSHLAREKALVLRSIKELEFDKAMGKVDEADFAEISAHLRERAVSLMELIEKGPAPSVRQTGRGEKPPRGARPGRTDVATHPAEPGIDTSAAPQTMSPAAVAAGGFCAACGTAHAAQANFCTQCGARL